MNHDSLIDAAAREMTQYEPSLEFRARVLGQLAAPPSRRWLPVIASVATVAAGIAAVVIVWRPSGPDAVAEPVATQTRVTAAPTQPAAVNPLSRDEVPVRSAATRGSVPDSLITEEELAWQARALAPLPAMAPVVIEPIQPSSLSITPIVVTPLVTEPLTVPRIDTDVGGRSPVPHLPNSLIS